MELRSEPSPSHSLVRRPPTRKSHKHQLPLASLIVATLSVRTVWQSCHANDQCCLWSSIDNRLLFSPLFSLCETRYSVVTIEGTNRKQSTMIYPSLKPPSRTMDSCNKSSTSLSSTVPIFVTTGKVAQEELSASSTTSEESSRSSQQSAQVRRRVSFNESRNKYVIDLPFLEERRRASYSNKDFHGFEADLAQCY